MMVISFAIIKLSLIALLGVFLYRRGIIDDKGLGTFTFLVVNIALPFLFFSRLLEHADFVVSGALWQPLLLSLLIYFVGFLLAAIFHFKRNHGLKREFIALVSFQNAGYLPINIGLFLLSGVLRDQFLVYIILYLLGFNILMWSIGSFFIFKQRGEKFAHRSIFTPPVIGSLLGLIVIYLNISQYIPEVILVPVSMIGETGFVLSMIILGCWLAKISLKGLKEKLGIIMGATILRLIVVPFIFLIGVIKLEIFSLLGLFIMFEAAMPSAVSLPIVATIRGGDSEFLSQGVLVTHILSIITVPVWLGIFLAISNFSF